MNLIAGIDEVGRGSWAGPLVVGLVIFRYDQTIDGLDDSKKLTKHRREVLCREIQQQAIAIGVGWVDANIIDKIGLSAALKLATERAYQQISAQIKDRIERIIIDGTIRLLDQPNVITMIKADGQIPSVSAASIVAKVFRDNYMSKIDKLFPNFSFSENVGYGTGSHQVALTKFGPIAGIHRQSFAPIAKQLGRSNKLPKIDSTIGRIAEKVAADYLKTLGHEIIAQNWRNKFCEIDIISQHKNVLYFIEVKYRKNEIHGSGLEAITTTKLKQMRFAADFYLTKNFDLTNLPEIRISAISLSQDPPSVDHFIDSIY